MPQRPFGAVPVQSGPSREASLPPKTPPRPAPVVRQNLEIEPGPSLPQVPGTGPHPSQQSGLMPNGYHDYRAQLSEQYSTQPPPAGYAQAPTPQYARALSNPYAQFQPDHSFQFQTTSFRSPSSSVPNQPPSGAPQLRQPQHDLLSSPSNSFSSLPDTITTATSPPSIPPPIPPSKPPPPSLLHLHSILLPHLSASLPPIIHSFQANRAHLIERHEDLASGEPAIRDEMARLEAVKKVCDSVGRRMAELVVKGEERVVELEGRGEVSVDEVVCGISIVHNQ